MRQALIIIFLFLGFNLLSQISDSIIVVFTITDQNNQRIEGVNVTVNHEASQLESVSNENGIVVFQVEKFGEISAMFTHPYYSKSTIIEEIYDNTTLDTLQFRVSLTSIKSLNLPEVTITSPGTPELVFSSERLHVQDFEIIDANRVILLTYPKQLKKGSQLILYDLSKVVLDSIEIEGEAIELTRDYEGHIYLIHSTACKRLIIDEKSIELQNVSLYYYRKYIEPIVGVYARKMFFSTYDALYPAFDYYYFNVIDSSYTKFASVIDTEMMEQYRAEYRFVDMRDPIQVRRKLEAKNLELQTGVDAEIYYGRQNYTRTIYYKAPFAPMFIIGNHLHLFDYHCDSLKTFNSDGNLLSKVRITHDYNERKSGWEKTLIHDRVDNQIYALYEKNGYYYLRSIDLTSGQLNKPIKLNHRFAEGIQVYNGYVYYIYRPFESYQKKYFWRGKIPAWKI